MSNDCELSDGSCPGACPSDLIGESMFLSTSRLEGSECIPAYLCAFLGNIFGSCFQTPGTPFRALSPAFFTLSAFLTFAYSFGGLPPKARNPLILLEVYLLKPGTPYLSLSLSVFWRPLT